MALRPASRPQTTQGNLSAKREPAIQFLRPGMAGRIVRPRSALPRNLRRKAGIHPPKPRPPSPGSETRRLPLALARTRTLWDGHLLSVAVDSVLDLVLKSCSKPTPKATDRSVRPTQTHEPGRARLDSRRQAPNASRTVMQRAGFRESYIPQGCDFLERHEIHNPHVFLGGTRKEGWAPVRFGLVRSSKLAANSHMLSPRYTFPICPRTLQRRSTSKPSAAR